LFKGKKILILVLTVILLFAFSFNCFADNSVVDFNNDGKIDLMDLVLLKRKIATQKPETNGKTFDVIDASKDTYFNASDLMNLTLLILGVNDTFEKTLESETIDL